MIEVRKYSTFNIHVADVARIQGNVNNHLDRDVT